MSMRSNQFIRDLNRVGLLKAALSIEVNRVGVVITLAIENCGPWHGGNAVVLASEAIDDALGRNKLERYLM